MPYTSVSAESRARIPSPCMAIAVSPAIATASSFWRDHQWPEYDPAFRGTLDWRGRAVLDVRHAATGHAGGGQQHVLPAVRGCPLHSEPRPAGASEPAPATAIGRLTRCATLSPQQSCPSSVLMRAVPTNILQTHSFDADRRDESGQVIGYGRCRRPAGDSLVNWQISTTSGPAKEKPGTRPGVSVTAIPFR